MAAPGTLDLLEVIDFVGNNLRRKRATKLAAQPGMLDPGNLVARQAAAENPAFAQILMQQQQLMTGQRQVVGPTDQAVFDAGNTRADRGLGLQERGVANQETQTTNQASQFGQSLDANKTQADSVLAQRAAELKASMGQWNQQHALAQDQADEATWQNLMQNTRATNAAHEQRNQFNAGQDLKRAELEQSGAQAKSQTELGLLDVLNRDKQYSFRGDPASFQQRYALDKLGGAVPQTAPPPAPSGVDYNALVAPAPSQDTSAGAGFARGAIDAASGNAPGSNFRPPSEWLSGTFFNPEAKKGSAMPKASSEPAGTAYFRDMVAPSPAARNMVPRGSFLPPQDVPFGTRAPRTQPEKWDAFPPLPKLGTNPKWVEEQRRYGPAPSGLTDLWSPPNPKWVAEQRHDELLKRLGKAQYRTRDAGPARRSK